MIKKIITASCKALALVAILFSVNSHSVQAQAKLTIGDAAPGIRYSKWLKGTPVNSMNDDKLYVLEFWATWCGPCIAAMPHLSELSEKYKEQAVFIGVNVLEKTGEKPYESALPNVERFVNSSANRMKYNVIADNNAQDMYNGWMKAAGIGGIPTTFVVHKQKIVWIGHPIKLDSVIPPILDGTYDMAAHKKVYDKDAGAQVKMMKELEEARASIKAAVEKKDFDGAFKLIDESIQKQPVFKLLFKFEKFKILLENVGEAEALKYAGELNRESDSYAIQVAMYVAEKEGLSKNLYQFALAGMEKQLEKNKFSALYNMLATLYSKSGDLKAAVQAQEKAVEYAKKEVNDPQFAGRVFNYTITDYEKKVQEYKSAIK